MLDNVGDMAAMQAISNLNLSSTLSTLKQVSIVKLTTMLAAVVSLAGSSKLHGKRMAKVRSDMNTPNTRTGARAVTMLTVHGLSGATERSRCDRARSILNRTHK